MWLFTRHGFFSVVYDKQQSCVVVRARREEDLLALKTFANLRAKIYMTPTRDYHCRLFLTPKVWERVSIELARNIDYPNFKDTIHREAGAERAHLYADIWRTHHRLQEGQKR